jgi:hypothetical protein
MISPVNAPSSKVVLITLDIELPTFAAPRGGQCLRSPTVVQARYNRDFEANPRAPFDQTKHSFRIFILIIATESVSGGQRRPSRHLA